ncbi:MAG: RHS repeat protein, partial [Candidatus Hydrogenedentes bacterium]|nr:RHS repeat protein [Candidatus Hydrogenedentota bacterium]
MISFSNTNRIETVEIKQGTNSAYQAVEIYHPYAWGWELTNVVTGTGTTALTNSFDYYQDAGDEFSYTKIKEKRFPNGGWEKWLYPDADNGGPNLQRRLRPWKDSPLTPDGADVTNSLVMRYKAWPGESLIDKKIIEYYGPYGGAVISGDADSSTYRTYTYMDRFSTGAVLIPDTAEETQCEGDEPTQYQIVRTHQKPGHYLSDLQGNIVFADYRDDAFEYFLGTYDPADYSFETNEISGTDFMSIVYHGTWDCGGIAGFYSKETAQGFVTYMDPLKGTREVKVYRGGNVIMEATEVLESVDPGTGEFNFEPISRFVSSYDSLGHLTNKVWLDPGNTNISRTVYSASWNLGAGDCELKTQVTDETGARLEFAYDSLKRLTNVVKAGVTNASYPSQVNIATNLTYDAAGRLRTLTVSAGGLSLSQSMTYDLAGRVTSSTGFDGITTSTYYGSDARITTNLTAGGVSTVLEYYRDGRLKSMTGNSQVSEYYDYDVTPDRDSSESFGGWIWVPKNLTRTSYGTTNSPRWVESLADLVRRPRQERYPGGGGTTVTNNWSYWSDCLPSRLYSKDWTAVQADGQTAALAEYFSYDGYGRTNELDWGNLQDVLRAEKTDVFYLKDGTNWFLVTTNFVWQTSGDVITGVEKVRLAGFSASNILSQTYQFDADTNLTVVTVTVDRSNKLLTEVIDTASSSLNATNFSLNGLQQLYSTATVSSPARFYYDALGRETSVKDPLGFTSSRTYDGYGQVASETGQSGATTRYGYYSPTHANARQLSAATNAIGNVTYFDYNTRGQLTHVWGDVPYPEMRAYDSQYGDMTELRTFQGGTDWSSSSLPSGFNGAASVTRWYYEAATGLVTNKTDAANYAVTFAYYPNKLLKTRTWARGVGTTNFYNEFGEMTAKAYSDGTPSVSYNNINSMGSPQEIIDGTGTNTLAYDHANRLILITGGAGLYSGLKLTNQTDSVYGRTSLRLLDSQDTILLQHDYGYDTYGRLAGVTNGVYSARYGYLANSDLIQTVTNRNNGTNVLTSTKAYEFGYRLASIVNVASNTTVSAHSYLYDAVDRRRQATLQDSSRWSYDYDDRDEVVSGKRSWSDWTPVAGQQFEYAYDSIGNRNVTKAGGDASGAGLRSANYTNNVLNEVTGRGVPGYVDIVGAAQATATNVSINGQSADHRKAEYYWKQLQVSNGSGALWQGVTNTATKDGTTATNAGSLLV